MNRPASAHLFCHAQTDPVDLSHQFQGVRAPVSTVKPPQTLEAGSLRPSAQFLHHLHSFDRSEACKLILSMGPLGSRSSAADRFLQFPRPLEHPPTVSSAVSAPRAPTASATPPNDSPRDSNKGRQRGRSRPTPPARLVLGTRPPPWLSDRTRHLSSEPLDAILISRTVPLRSSVD